MHHSISSKLFIFSILVIIIMIASNIILINSYYGQEISSILKNEVHVIGQFLKLQLDRLLALEISLEDLFGFEEQCQEVVSKYPIVDFAMIVSSDGEVLFHNDSEQINTKVKIPEILTIIDDSENCFVEYKEKSQRKNSCIISIYDLNHDFLGNIVIGMNQGLVNQEITLTVSYSVILILLFFIITILLLFLSLHYLILLPLKKMDQATHLIGLKGIDSFSQLDIKSNDEIGRLANSLNFMADELKKNMVSKEYMDSIISSMLDALIVLNSDFEIITINNAALELLGYQRPEIVNKPFIQLFSNAKEFPFPQENIKKFKNIIIRNYETNFLSQKSESIPILFSSSIMLDNFGDIKYIVCTAREITQLKQTEEALLVQTQKFKQSKADLEEFTFTASNELKEPLKKINSLAELLQEKYCSQLEDKGKECIEEIQSSVSKMENLIIDLLSYSRVNSNDGKPSKQDLAKIIKAVLFDLKIQIEKSSGTFEIGFLPHIVADEVLLRQLFQNLIENALKFYKKGIPPVVKIYAVEEIVDGYWNIIIEDNGIGMSSRDFEFIFGIFHRIDRNNIFSGNGIGLALCKKIIEQHGGFITVESQINVGSRFILHFPSNY